MEGVRMPVKGLAFPHAVKKDYILINFSGRELAAMGLA